MTENQSRKLILGLQSWSVREQLRISPIDTLAKISNLGFNYIETTDLEEAEQLKPLAEDHGIKIKSSFLFWLHITGNWHLKNSFNYPWSTDKTTLYEIAEKSASLGLTHINLGYISEAERDINTLKRVTEKLNYAAEIFSRFGLVFSYHNHAFEFENKNGFVFYDYLIQNTDANLVKLELDTLWSHVTGFDLINFIENFSHRIELIHLKNIKPHFPMTYDDSKMPDNFFTSLDDGTIAMKELFQKAINQGIHHFYIEQDFSENIFTDLDHSFQFCENNRLL